METQKIDYVIGVDFDGTVVTNEYPRVGRDIGAVPVLKKLIENGYQLVLFTMRSNMPEVTQLTTDSYIIKYECHLNDAVNWFKENDIPLYGVNKNPAQKEWTDSPKAYCQLYIDDAGINTPLIHPDNGEKPYVDWVKIEEILINMKLIK